MCQKKLYFSASVFTFDYQPFLAMILSKRSKHPHIFIIIVDNLLLIVFVYSRTEHVMSSIVSNFIIIMVNIIIFREDESLKMSYLLQTWAKLQNGWKKSKRTPSLQKWRTLKTRIPVRRGTCSRRLVMETLVLSTRCVLITLHKTYKVCCKPVSKKPNKASWNST